MTPTIYEIVDENVTDHHDGDFEIVSRPVKRRNRDVLIDTPRQIKLSKNISEGLWCPSY